MLSMGVDASKKHDFWLKDIFENPPQTLNKVLYTIVHLL
jgi:hypothetical protein